MLGTTINKLFDFMTDGVCEHCGVSSKTTLCSTCHQELMESIQKSSPQLRVLEGGALQETDSVPENTEA